MAITAENLAEQYDITRQAQDEFACRSQQTAAAAQEAGRLAEEIVPTPGHGKRGEPIAVDRTSTRAPRSTLESPGPAEGALQGGRHGDAGQRQRHQRRGGDAGAGTAGWAEGRGLRPLGRLVSWAVVGVRPEIMGIGPAPAIRQALKRADLTLDEMDLIEVNEAFAAQYLAVEKELGLDRERVNVNGGAIALGHPLAPAARAWH